MSDSLDSDDVVDFAEFAAQAEVAGLLDFEPVPRKVKRPDGWNPERQRDFIVRLLALGTAQAACAAMRKKVSGIEALYEDDEKGEFRAAWDRAEEIVADREQAELDARPAPAVPPHRRRSPSLSGADAPPPSPFKGEGWVEGPEPGEVLNEFGEWEDGEALARRAEEARESVSAKLLRSRRLYLQEISTSAGKRAAFEILTELPVDWDRAGRLEPQADEPWRRPSQRDPDMILTAESGWSFGELGYGPDRKARARKAIDEWRGAEGLEPINWQEDE